MNLIIEVAIKGNNLTPAQERALRELAAREVNAILCDHAEEIGIEPYRQIPDAPDDFSVCVRLISDQDLGLKPR